MERRLGWLAIFLICLLGCTGWAQANGTSNDNQAAAVNSKTAAPTTAPSPDYVIGPDDVLHISVWNESQLTEILPVRSDGKISVPLLGDVTAAGLTPTQLAASLTEKLRKYVTDPRVTVIVTAMNSQKIYVTGEVTRAGSMALTPNMTVLQALASAGFTQFANTKGIYILRVENGKQQKIPVNYKKLIKGQAMDQNILLKPSDTVVVP